MTGFLKPFVSRALALSEPPFSGDDVEGPEEAKGLNYIDNIYSAQHSEAFTVYSDLEGADLEEVSEAGRFLTVADRIIADVGRWR